MIDHVLGRPDPRYRKYQILAVVALWSVFIYTKPNGPRPISKLSKFLGRRLTVWQTVVLTLLTEYARRNFKKFVTVLQAPEPLVDMYNRDYFRATWVTTALDAGFWTAMRIRPNWLKDFCSMVFTLYYLVNAEHADEMVRKVRGKLSLEHLRVSWNKGETPYLAFVGRLIRPPRLRMRYKPRQIRIPRPKQSPYTEPVHAWLYFDGPLEDMRNQDKVILDIPGGGFVAMNPRCHDDKLMAWAAKTGFPIVSLDYRKAPEYPYPYALNECFDAYHSIVVSRGRLVGLPGDTVPRVIISGDSAGGNLAVGVVLMMLQARTGTFVNFHDQRHGRHLPLPEALILIYPALDVNITSWLTDEQSLLIKDPTRRKQNEGVVRRKTEDYHTIINTPVPSDDEDDEESLRMTRIKQERSSPRTSASPQPAWTNDSEHGTRFSTQLSNGTPSLPNGSAKEVSLSTPAPRRTRLEMTSMISYFNDRIISPEMLRAMIILYLGEHKRPDFTTEYLLSPLRAPEELLREFPKVYMMTGERDPLSDDTALFAGRLLEAKLHQFQSRQEAGIISDEEEFRDEDYVYYELVSGVSHGFLQFATIYHHGFELIERCSRWIKTAFDEAEKNKTRRKSEMQASAGDDYFGSSAVDWRDSTPELGRVNGLLRISTKTSEPEDRPLEMSSSFSISSTIAHDRRPSSSSSTERRDASGRGKIKKPAFSGRKSPVLSRKSPSLQNLTSLDDIMERRMQNVTLGLNGSELRPKTPM